MAQTNFSQAFLYFRETGECKPTNKSYLKMILPAVSLNYTSIQELERTSWEDIVKNPKNGFKKLQEGIYGVQLYGERIFTVLINKTLEDFERFCKKNNLPFRPENVLQKNSNVKEAFKQFVEKLRKIEGYDQRVGTIGSEGFDFIYASDKVFPLVLKEDGLFHPAGEQPKKSLSEIPKFSSLRRIMLDNYAIRPEDLLKWIEKFIDKTEVWVKKNNFKRITRFIDGDRNKRVGGIVNLKNKKVVFMIPSGEDEYQAYYATYSSPTKEQGLSSADFLGKLEEGSWGLEFLENVVKPKLLKNAEKSSGDKGKDFFENIIVKVFNVCNPGNKVKRIVEDGSITKISDTEYSIHSGNTEYTFIADKLYRNLLIKSSRGIDIFNEPVVVYGPKKFKNIKRITEIMKTIKEREQEL